MNRQGTRTIKWVTRYELHGPPNMSLHKHACEVTSPIAAGPPQTLLEKHRVVFQSGLHLSLLVILNVGFPAMRYGPPGNEIVVVRVEMIPAEPGFIGETVGKGLILEHTSTIGHRPTRKTRDSSIHVRTGSTVKVPPL